MAMQPGTRMDRSDLEGMLRDWPEEPRKRAGELIDTYGMPDEATQNRLIWHGNGPWKRTILHRRTVRHEFPVPHEDFLEQVIDYNIPVEKMDDIIEFDGSLKVWRTAGEVAAICHMEEANYSALNLMHEVVTGERTPEDARRGDFENMNAVMGGERPPQVQGFQFDVPQGGTADPDRSLG